MFKNMKTAQIHKFGGSKVIEIAEVEKPKPGLGQVLVKIYAASINPFDYKVRGGMIPSMKLPFTLGGDIAGVVAEVGQGVENFVVGNKIYGQAIVLAGATGAFSEFAAVPVNFLATMPKNLDFPEAAAAVLVGVSAVQALAGHTQLKAGQKILIHGGAGGVGHLASSNSQKNGA